MTLRYGWFVACAVVPCCAAPAPLDQLVPSPALSVGATGVSIRDVVNATPSGGTVALAAGTYWIHDSALVVGGVSGISIRGAGPGLTVLRFGDGVPAAIELRDGVTGIRIENLSIEGPGDLAPRGVAGILIDDRRAHRAIRNITLRNLVIRGVNVGMRLGTSCGPPDCDGGVDSVFVTDNVIVAPLGTVSGSGYGVALSNVTHAVISNNLVVGAGRHAIYQGHSLDSGSVVIARNVIVDHGHSQGGAIENAALAVARSSGVVVAGNVIVNSRNFAISVECDEDEPRRRLSPIWLIGNSVIGNHRQDLYLTAIGTYLGWGNRFAHAASMIGDTVLRIERSPCGEGMGRLVPPRDWEGAIPLVTDPALFAYREGALYRLGAMQPGGSSRGLTVGDSVSIGEVVAIAAGRERVVAVQSRAIVVVEANTLEVTRLPTRRWEDHAEAVVVGSHLVVREGRHLFQVDVRSGAIVTDITTRWQDIRAMVPSQTGLYVLVGNCIYAASVPLGAVTLLGCYSP